MGLDRPDAGTNSVGDGAYPVPEPVATADRRSD